MILGARPRRVDVMQIDDICELLPTPKTTLYYDPDGRCESAYVQLRTGRPVKKVEPDPRYLVSVYFGVGEVPIGIRMSECAPDSVLLRALEMCKDATAGLVMQVREAGSRLNFAA